MTKSNIILSSLLAISIIGNTIFINITIKTKKKITDIVQERTEYVSSEIDKMKKQYDTETEKRINDLKKSFSMSEALIAPDKNTKKEDIVYIKVVDKTYETALSNDLDKSKEQVRFLSNKLTELSNLYEQEIINRDEMIINLKKLLEESDKALAKDLTNRELNDIKNKIKKDLLKFGIDVYTHIVLPKDFVFVPSYGAGIGFNVLISRRVNIRINAGALFDSNYLRPNFGVAIGYYF